MVLCKAVWVGIYKCIILTQKMVSIKKFKLCIPIHTRHNNYWGMSEFYQTKAVFLIIQVQHLALPITTTNVEVVYVEDPTVNAQRMYNFCNIMVTSDNRPVLFQFSYTQNKTLAFMFNGSNWVEVTNNWLPNFSGEGIIDDNNYITLLREVEED